MKKNIFFLLIMIFFIFSVLNCEDEESAATPDQPGIHLAGYLTLTLTDDSRSREIPLRITYPALSEGENASFDDINAPYPVVVFSHGWSECYDMYDFIINHLAEHGYVIIAPNHVLSDGDYIFGSLENALTQWGMMGLLSHMEELSESLAPYEEVRHRPADVSFVLDYAENTLNVSHDFLAGNLDMTKVGIAGHSYGGLTCFLSSGGLIDLSGVDLSSCPDMLDPTKLDEDPPSEWLACTLAKGLQDEGASFPLDLSDDRIKAAAPMAPVSEIIFGENGIANIDIPFMIFGGTLDQLAIYEPNQVDAFDELISDKYMLSLIGGDHMNFSDDIDEFENFLVDLPSIYELLNGQTVKEFLDSEEIQAVLAMVGDALDVNHFINPTIPVEDGYPYMRGFMTAFFDFYLKEDASSQAYLSQSYANRLSGSDGTLVFAE